MTPLAPHTIHGLVVGALMARANAHTYRRLAKQWNDPAYAENARAAYQRARAYVRQAMQIKDEPR